MSAVKGRVAEQLAGRPRRRRSPFGLAVKEAGVTFIALADQSGYHERHVRRVAWGEHPGTRSFHELMRRLLGIDYEMPRSRSKP